MADRVITEGPRIWDFPGGLKLDEHKSESTRDAIRPLDLPDRLVLPLAQHIGNPAVAIVEAGDRVQRGQMLATADGYVSAPIHAPTSGVVASVDDHPVAHPSGLSATCIIIEPDGRDEAPDAPTLEPLGDYQAADPGHLRNHIRQAGIVGLGGAAFPSYIKLNPGTRGVVDTLILNGAECEPYISCDQALMREYAAEILAGIGVMLHALDAPRCLIGVEDNKPQAIAALRKAIDDSGRLDVDVIEVPTRYPQGGEKQLIRTLTGRDVPSEGLPLDIGVVCHNVATARAVWRAVQFGEPLTHRIVTVTGGAIPNPGNYLVPLGTPVHHLIRAAGGQTEPASRIIMGGPMMGFALHDDAVPVVKATNCILVPDAATVAPPEPAMPCIRCGDCVEVCPANLLPQQLYWHARARELKKVQEYSLFDCIECGCCAQVCPSHIPLVQYYRFAKTEIWSEEQERKKADIARERHEARAERLEREKAERAEIRRRKREAMKKKAEAMKQDSGPADAAATPDTAAATADKADDPVQRAIERARAKKAAAQNNADDGETP